MYKIATITFHHAHNYGSVLQAYALQEFIKQMGRETGKEVDYKIIDFYTPFQEEFYSVFKKTNSLKNIIKNVLAFPYAKQLLKKHEKFEVFLREYCQLTDRYFDEEELYDNFPKADCYISGSDQLWNVRALDFSWVYYLSFLQGDVRCISYAASMGPLMIQWSDEQKLHCQELLGKYTAVSVREKNTKKMVEEVAKMECEIHVDPTLLLPVEEWRKIQSDTNYNNGKYILLYCLEPSKIQLKMAKAISKKLNLPVVVLRYNNKNDIINNFVKKYAAGPNDFLSYIDNAALVLSSSFHGTAFSLIYRKPFYVFNGMNDNRISSILNKMGMKERSIDGMEDVNRVSLDALNSDTIERVLKHERNVSANYLMEALKFE